MEQPGAIFVNGMLATSSRRLLRAHGVHNRRTRAQAGEAIHRWLVLGEAARNGKRLSFFWVQSPSQHLNFTVAHGANNVAIGGDEFCAEDIFQLCN